MKFAESSEKEHPHMIRDWVELNMTPGIGPRAAAKLLGRFGSAEAVYNATRSELEQLRLAPEAVDTIIARDLRSAAEAEIAAVKKKSTRLNSSHVALSRMPSSA